MSCENQRFDVALWLATKNPKYKITIDYTYGCDILEFYVQK
jgi:hypothetical protein